MRKILVSSPLQRDDLKIKRESQTKIFWKQNSAAIQGVPVGIRGVVPGSDEL